MPLHERDTVREQMEDSVFSGHNVTRPVPKYRFPRDETRRGMRTRWWRMR